MEKPMIPDLQTCLLCDDVRQEISGKLILIGIFDSIGIPNYPFVYPRAFLVTRWCSGEGEFVQQARILNPDNSVLVEGKPLPFKLNSNENIATNIEMFMNLQFKQPGLYWFELLLNNSLELRYPLRLTKINLPQQPKQG